MKQIAIRASALTRQFSSVRALDDLTIEVPAGVVFGFLGPNGAGKTTTIRLLLNLIEPTSGSAEVLGFDTRTHGHEIRSRCGSLLEHSGLYERLSAEDNLRFYGCVAHMTERDIDCRIEELLTRMGLWDRRKETVVKWSRGMKQKLAIARAVLHRPDLVFLDEPTAGLDPVAANDLRKGLAALVSQQGTTIFLTTHNMAEAETLCNLVAVIRQGRLLAFGNPAAACTSYGWLLTIITIVVGVITINAANWSGHVLFYRSAASWLAIILLPPLVGGAVASAGILASLHAATVRQAQQTLMFGIIAVGLALSFGLPTLLKWLARNLAAWSVAEVVVGGSAVFLAVDLVLVLAARNHFQRSKLVLD